jgi:tRNA threonylcarbamoyladenosine biosynthesis protein TsaE
MIMKEKIVRNLEDLRGLAEEFVRTLKGGEVIGLVGELGAGKTAFVQEISRALGVKREVKSPTFVLMQVYPTGEGTALAGIRRLCHVDAYRLKDEGELYGIGFEDYAGKPGVVSFVEWAERIPSLHGREGYQEVTIGFGEGEERIFRFKAE